VEQTPLVEDITIQQHCVADIFPMNYIAQCCPQLKRIHLYGISNCGILASLAQHCHHLHHVVLIWPTGPLLESLTVFKDFRLESLEIDIGFRFIPPLSN
jgi:hypothetical protein